MIGALRTPEDARWYRLSIWVLVTMTWAVLAVWGASPFGVGAVPKHLATPRCAALARGRTTARAIGTCP